MSRTSQVVACRPEAKVQSQTPEYLEVKSFPRGLAPCVAKTPWMIIIWAFKKDSHETLYVSVYTPDESLIKSENGQERFAQYFERPMGKHGTDRLPN